MVKSIFDDFDMLIIRALGFNIEDYGGYFDLSSTCRRITLCNDALSLQHDLVESLFEKINDNMAHGDLSRNPALRALKPNWLLRHRTNIDPTNTSCETILERAISKLSEREELTGWYNQIPTASGLVGSSFDKACNVDLVHSSNGSAELVELKWSSEFQGNSSRKETPIYALFQILRYGMAMLLSRTNPILIEKYRGKSLMETASINLSVLAPPSFYQGANCEPCAEVIVNGLSQLIRSNSLDMKLKCRFIQFPYELESLYKSGAELNNMFDAKHLRSKEELMEAMNSLELLWEVAA